MFDRMRAKKRKQAQGRSLCQSQTLGVLLRKRCRWIFLFVCLFVVVLRTLRCGCGGQNRFGIPFWLIGEFTTHCRTYVSGDWDVHWGVIAFDPWPCDVAGLDHFSLVAKNRLESFCWTDSESEKEVVGGGRRRRCDRAVGSIEFGIV